MKALTTLSFIIFLVNLTAFSQDIITKKNGEDIVAKVLEITPEEIKFKKWDNLEGPIFSIYKTDALIIRYKNGSKDLFNSVVNQPENNVTNQGLNNGSNIISKNSDISLFEIGKNDAQRNYRGYKGAATGTLVTGLFVGSLIGLVPALITSSTPSSDFNLNYPDSNKMNNKDYHSGYTGEAFKIKKNKVWSNWGIALGLNLITYLILVKK